MGQVRDERPDEWPDDYTREARCTRCRLSPRLCVCHDVESVELPFEILVIRHSTERSSLSNTGGLVPLFIRSARLEDYGVQGAPFSPAVLGGDECESRLLFPRPQARELEPAASWVTGGRGRLVVLDGTWPKAKKMAHRVPELRTMAPVRLPDSGSPEPTLRKPFADGFYTTIDAVVRAIRALGFSSEAYRIEAQVRRVLTARFFLRGKIDRRTYESWESARRVGREVPLSPEDLRSPPPPDDRRAGAQPSGAR